MNVRPDLIGDAFEYLIKKFAESGVKHLVSINWESQVIKYFQHLSSAYHWRIGGWWRSTRSRNFCQTCQPTKARRAQRQALFGRMTTSATAVATTT